MTTEQQVDRTPPFQNCRFRECDLPGQCRAEGKCHHPAAPAPSAQEVLWVVTRLKMLYNFRLPAEGGQILELKDGMRITAPTESRGSPPSA
jgi:hypothetical protein